MNQENSFVAVGRKAGLMLSVVLAMLITVSFAMPSAKAEEIYLIRGLFDAYSDGMNQIASRLKTRGYNATVTSNGRWGNLAYKVVQRNKKQEVSHPIIIAGFSAGGVEAVEFANFLARRDIPVKLVVGVDAGASLPSRLHRNVKLGKTYRARTGHKFRPGTRFNGKITDESVLYLKVRHKTIMENPLVIDKVYNDILGAL